MKSAVSRLTPWALTLPWFIPASAHETNFSEWFPVTEYPNAQAENLSYWQAEAARVAGTDLWADYAHRCINSQQKYPEIGSARQIPGFVAPARPFDSLFFVGSSEVSVWAVDTGDGLILFDAMWTAIEAEKVIIPGLQSFGYDGSDVKALVITHEHIDHYGGAAWLQTTYNMPVYASEPAWDGLENAEDDYEKPTRDKILTDCQDFTVGNTTIKVYLTPGHTPGTLSFLIPLCDRGEEHLAGFYGGGGIPASVEDKVSQIQSFQRFARLVEKHGADVLLSNHQTQDSSLQHFDVLANRICDGDSCSLPNPYVVGTERYARYLKVMELCVRVHAARVDQDLDV